MTVIKSIKNFFFRCSVVITINLSMLKEVSFNYTFFNANGKTNRLVMDIDELREDGIGEILVETGRMSNEEYERLMRLYEGENT